MPFCASCGSGHSGRDPQCPTCGVAVPPLVSMEDVAPVGAVAADVAPAAAPSPTFRPNDRYLIAFGVPAQSGFAAWYYSTYNNAQFLPAFAGYLVFVGLLWWAVGALARAKRRRASWWWLFTMCFGPFPLLVLLFVPRART